MLTIHPLNTPEQRAAYYRGMWHTQMDRGQKATILELLATSASQIEQPLLVAEAASVVENAMSHCDDDHKCVEYYSGTPEEYDDDWAWDCPRCAEYNANYSVYSELLEGFDQPDLTIEVARDLIEGIAYSAAAGIFQSYPRQFGAAIAVLIDPAWKTDIRARLELFHLLYREKKSF